MNYFAELEKLNKAIGFGPERTDVLIYAENETMSSIQQRDDLDRQKANANAGFIPLGQITRIKATKPGEGTKLFCVLHIPLCYHDTAELRKRMANAIFELNSDVSACFHTDFAKKKLWLCERKDWLGTSNSLQTQ